MPTIQFSHPAMSLETEACPREVYKILFLRNKQKWPKPSNKWYHPVLKSWVLFSDKLTLFSWSLHFLNCFILLLLLCFIMFEIIWYSKAFNQHYVIALFLFVKYSSISDIVLWLSWKMKKHIVNDQYVLVISYLKIYTNHSKITKLVRIWCSALFLFTIQMCFSSSSQQPIYQSFKWLLHMQSINLFTLLFEVAQHWMHQCFILKHKVTQFILFHPKWQFVSLSVQLLSGVTVSHVWRVFQLCLTTFFIYVFEF